MHCLHPLHTFKGEVVRGQGICKFDLSKMQSVSVLPGPELVNLEGHLKHKECSQKIKIWTDFMCKLPDVTVHVKQPSGV